MSEHYDDLETRAPAAREADLMARLPQQIAHAQQHSSAFASILQGVDASRITSRAALAQLPVTRKYELLARQQAEREAAAARLKANDAELAKFYQGETEPEAEEPEASSPDSTGDSSPVSPPPAGFQADGRPIGDQMPAPR